MHASRRSLSKKRFGAHVIEFAIVAPIFFLFVFAIIDIGRGLMVCNLLSQAARTGCRTGVLPSKTNTDVQAAVNQTMTSLSLSGATTTVQVNGKTADVGTATTKDLITVSVSVPIANVTWLPTTWFVTGNLNGQFSLPHE